ncbi:hypothetical protein MRX96_010565 [Rhipicephalus microplus]
MDLINSEMPLAVATAYARASDTAANASTSSAANTIIHEVASKMAELLDASGRFRMAESVRTIRAIFLLPMEDDVVDALYESVPVTDSRRTLFGSLALTTSTMAQRRLAALGARLDHLSLPLFARPLDARLRYVESLHALLVPMVVLEPPVFRETLTDSVNYGSFGRLIAEAQANNHRIAASDVRLLGFQDFSDEQTYFIAGCYLPLRLCGGVVRDAVSPQSLVFGRLRLPPKHPP